MIKDITLVGSGEELAAYRLGGVVNSLDVEEDDLADLVRSCEGLVLLTPEADAKLADRLDGIKKDLIVARIPSAGEYNRVNEIIKDTIGFELRR